MARLNAASLARDGFVAPLSLRTNCSADARISSSVAGGSKLASVLIFLHIGGPGIQGGATATLKFCWRAVFRQIVSAEDLLDALDTADERIDVVASRVHIHARPRGRRHVHSPHQGLRAMM